MSSDLSNNMRMFLFLLLSTSSSIVTAAKPIFGSDPPGRIGRPLSSSEIAAREKRKAVKALKAYEERNAEIDSWIEDYSILHHKNAALLYYQALLLRPDHKQTVINRFYDVYGGAEPDTQIKTFLGEWLASMKVAEIASRIPQCNWEIYHERMWPPEKRSRIFIIESFRRLSHIIAVDAITLASDGKYHAALERCMTLRRIARHLSYDPALHISSGPCDGIAIKTIPRILSSVPLDSDILAWFQGELAKFHEPTTFLERTLQEHLEAQIDEVHSSSIPRLRGILLKRTSDERAKQNIRALSDDEIKYQAIKAVHVFHSSIFTMLHNDKSAEQKQTEMQELTNSPTNRDALEVLAEIQDALGEGAVRLITGIHIQSAEGQKLSEVQRIIDKPEEHNTIELLTRFSSAMGEEVDFGFLANRELAAEKRLAKMQKAIDDLNEAFAVETSTLVFPWRTIERIFESQVSYTAHIDSLKIAVQLYLVMAKTGQLPKELPEYLPKDPYTGRDFFYEITEFGFVLGCQSDVFKTGKQRFEFSIRFTGDRGAVKGLLE